MLGNYVADGEIEGGGSFMSQSDLRAHFGLGRTSRAYAVDVRWPSGERQEFRDVPGDAFYQIVEGSKRLDREHFGCTPPREKHVDHGKKTP